MENRVKELSRSVQRGRQVRALPGLRQPEVGVQGRRRRFAAPMLAVHLADFRLQLLTGMSLETPRSRVHVPADDVLVTAVLQRTELATEEFHDRNSLRRSAIEKGVLHVLVKDHGTTHVALIDELIIPLGHLLRSFLLPISFSIRRFPGGSLRRTTFRVDPDSPE